MSWRPPTPRWPPCRPCAHPTQTPQPRCAPIAEHACTRASPVFNIGLIRGGIQQCHCICTVCASCKAAYIYSAQLQHALWQGNSDEISCSRTDGFELAAGSGGCGPTWELADGASAAGLQRVSQCHCNCAALHAADYLLFRRTHRCATP
jgi:hypothetical protein